MLTEASFETIVCRYCPEFTSAAFRRHLETSPASREPEDVAQALGLNVETFLEGVSDVYLQQFSFAQCLVLDEAGFRPLWEWLSR